MQLGSTSITGAFVGNSQVTRLYQGSLLIANFSTDFAYSVDLAPPEDVPVITTGAVGAYSSTTIAGSDGWWREKRVEVPETVAGNSQSSSAPLDLPGSTYFAYPGFTSATGHAANPGNYVSTGAKPGGGSVNALWVFNLSFTTSSPTVEIRLRCPSPNPSLGLVLVNGKKIQERVVETSFGSAGSGFGAKLTFPDSRERTITIFGLCQGRGDFGGIAVEGGYSVSRPSTEGKTIAIIGDSYTNGHNSVSSVETFAWRLAFRLGADVIIQAGIGGTGWGATVSDNPVSNFAGRIAEVMAMEPDTVIFAGGRNDDSSIQTLVEESLDAVGPVERYVLTTASESQVSTREAIEAACLSRSVPYLNTAVDSLPKIADGVHPTYEGHKSLADDAYTQIQGLA